MFSDIYALIAKGISSFNGYLSYVLIVFLLVGGVYFTFRTRFAQFRLFKQQIKAVTEKPGKKGGVSSFQALMVSTASRVGTGNIVGVSVALCTGGFGSVFWMWLIALIGGASALIESTLAQIYKKKGKDGFYGGPAYYIEKGVGSRALALVFCVFLISTYGFGFNMLASYNLQSTFSEYSFYKLQIGSISVMPWIIGFVTAVLVGYCLFGGGKRIVKITSVLVPIMGAAYVLVALLVVVLNITSLPEVFARIFREAFDFKAIFGGFSGSCVMMGIKRGLFSNEAGVGSAPNASASADVSHPVTQGLVQSLSVFIDTILVCSATAFMCMCSGIEPNESISGALYVQLSLEKFFGSAGPVFITVAMILFAFTTLLGNLYYVDKCFFYMLKREPGKKFNAVYYVLASLVIFVGAGLESGILWDIADITMGLMAIINIPVMFILGKYALRAIDDYDKKRKSGKELYFKAEDVGLSGTVDYWN